MVAETGFEPVSLPYEGNKGTAPLLRNKMVGEGGLEPPQPEGDGFTARCNCRYATLPNNGDAGGS